MKPFTSIVAALAAIALLGIGTAPLASAGALTSVRQLDGAIGFSPTDVDPPSLVVSDTGFPLIANSYSPLETPPPVASYIGDAGNGRFGANVDVRGGNFASSHILYSETVTNSTDHDVDLTFSFYLRPGQVQLVGTPTDRFWEGSADMSAGIVWDKPDDVDFAPTIWAVSASIVGDSVGGLFPETHTEKAPGFEFVATDTGFTYAAYEYSLALGKLGAGQTKELQYFMDVSGFYREDAPCNCNRSAFAAIVDDGGHAAVGAFDPLSLGGTPGIHYLAVVPEPETWAMFGLGLIALFGAARRRAGVATRECCAG